MRRGVSCALLLLILGALLAPAELATVTSPAPACCRASGRHHCTSLTESSGQVVTSACPYRRPLPFHQSARPQPATRPPVAIDEHPFLREFYPQLFPSPAEPTPADRGPPTPGSSSR